MKIAKGTAGPAVYQQKIAYNSDGLAEYIGYASPGKTAADSGWQIQKLTYDTSNRVTAIQLAGSTTDFSSVWDSRESLVYG